MHLLSNKQRYHYMSNATCVFYFNCWLKFGSKYSIFFIIKRVKIESLNETY